MSASTRSKTSTQPSSVGTPMRSSGTVSSSRSSRSGLITIGALRIRARLNSCMLAPVTITWLPDSLLNFHSFNLEVILACKQCL